MLAYESAEKIQTLPNLRLPISSVHNAIFRQIIGFLSVAGVLSAGIYGATQIEALYDPIWYLREDSYPAQFLYAMEDYFPTQGVAVSVYVGERQINFT